MSINKEYLIYLIVFAAEKAKKEQTGVPTVKQFFINIKRDEIFSSLLHTTLPCKVVCYTVFYFRAVNK